jgi:hypothetical protein
MREQMDQQYYDLRNKIKITQQAVLDTSDELKAETVQLKESIQVATTFEYTASEVNVLE